MLGKQIREIINENGGTEVLLTECDNVSSYNGNNYLPLLWKFYKSYRKALFRLIELLEIQPATQDQSLISALNFLITNKDKRIELLPFTLNLDFVNTQWQNTVTAKEGENTFLVRRHLEICIFYHLALGLKTGDLCINTSENFADYRNQLLSWEAGKIVFPTLLRKLNNYSHKNSYINHLES